MVEINRVWLNVDTDTNKITLFGRPRVSIHVDEYIWSLIEEHLSLIHIYQWPSNLPVQGRKRLVSLYTHLPAGTDSFCL